MARSRAAATSGASRTVASKAEPLSQWAAQSAAAEFSKAEAFRQLALLRQELGEYDQSLQHWEESRRILNELIGVAPTDRPYRQKLAQVLVEMAAHHRLRSDDRTRTRQLEQEAMEIRKKLALEQPADAGAQHQLAMSLNNVALVPTDPAQAKTHLQGAIKIWESLAERFPREQDYREHLVRGMQNLGYRFGWDGQLAESLAAHEQALKIGEQLARESPDSARFHESWANCHHHLGNTYENALKQPATVVRHREQAVQIMQEFVSRHPECPPEVRDKLASLQNELASSYQLQGETDKAERAYRENLRTYTELTRAAPEVVSLQVSLAGAESNLGNVLHMRGLDDEGIESLVRAKERLDKVLRRTGGDALARKFRDITLGHLGRIYSARAVSRAAQGDEPGALADFLQARDLRRELASSAPQNADYATDLGGTLCMLGNWHMTASRQAESLDFYTQAIAALQPVVERRSGPPASRFLRNAHRGRSSALVDMQRYTEAYADICRAVELDDESRWDMQLHKLAIRTQVGGLSSGLEIEALLESEESSAERCFQAASLYALAASASTSNDHREQFYRRATELLTQAHAGGYFNDAGRIAQLKNFADLSGHKDFETLRQEIAASAARPDAAISKPQPD